MHHVPQALGLASATKLRIPCQQREAEPQHDVVPVFQDIRLVTRDGARLLQHVRQPTELPRPIDAQHD